jgi:hypothetical protein
VSAPCFVYRKVAGRVVSERVHDARTLERRLRQGYTLDRSGVAPKPPEPVAAPEPPAEDVTPTREELEAKAEELGVKIDKRWGDKRLMQEVVKALEGKGD